VRKNVCSKNNDFMIPPQLLAYSEQLSRFEHLRNLPYDSKFGLIEQIADSPAYRIAENVNNTPLGVLKRLNEEFERLRGYRPNSELLEYLEETAKTSREFSALSEEIDQKAEIIEPIVRQYRMLIEQEYGIFLGSIKEIVVALYLNDDIEEMRFYLPDTIAQDLKRYAIEKKAEFLALPVGNDESNGRTVQPLTLAEPPVPNQSETAPAGSQSGPALSDNPNRKSTHKSLRYALFHFYLQHERIAFLFEEGKKMKEIKDLAVKYRLKSAKKFQLDYNKIKELPNRLSVLKNLDLEVIEELRGMLKDYPKPLQRLDNEINKRR
jgi:hypothetical protein